MPSDTSPPSTSRGPITGLRRRRGAASGLRRRLPRSNGSLLRGPLPTLPRPLDAAVEGWWRLPARLRVLAGVAVAGMIIFGVVEHTTAAPWGPPVQVVVATADAGAGSAVSAEVVDRPRRLVPADALDALPEGLLARDIGAGEVVTSRHLATGIDGLLEPGEVALAVPDELPPLPAHARMEVLATTLDGTASRLGTARLVATEPDWLWIAVSTAIAPDVAAAMARGGIALALAPP